MDSYFEDSTRNTERIAESTLRYSWTTNDYKLQMHLHIYIVDIPGVVQ